MTTVAVAGVGLTVFGRYLDRPLKNLAAEATLAACSDASISPSEIDFVAGSNSLAGLLTGQECVRTQTVLAPLGIRGVPVFNVENACASASSAFNLAVRAVAHGEARCALAIGFEKMSHPDRTKTLAALTAAADLDEAQPEDPLRSMFMDLYAEEVRHHMENYGSTAEDFARIVVKNRSHAALNPHAQYRSPCDIEDVLSSPVVTPPLTKLMCSPVGDGAAAVVLFAAEQSRIAPIVAASEIRSGTRLPTHDENDAVLVARAAYEAAGLGPDDVTLAEVHDAAAPAELLAYEDLGFAPRGEGSRLIRDGVTSLGGAKPVNTSGGLIARGHPIGATGLAMVVEGVLQLRGQAGDRQVEGARVALVQNAGGWVGEAPAASAVHILRTP